MLLLGPEIQVVSFTKVKLPNGWFGNMAPYTIRETANVGDLVWRTGEAFFQSRRFTRDSAEFFEIYDARSPMTVKMIAKKNLAKMILAPRSDADVESMRETLRLKLHDHPELIPLLVDTGTATIVEDVSARPSESGLFWGMQRVGDGWRGHNRLGKLWMELRGSHGGL